jgi:hypothetical protein
MEEQTQSHEAGTVIVMLDNQCASPCYSFDTDHREICVMSPKILDEVLEWVSQLQPSPPGVLYMVGAPQTLEQEVRETLEDVAERVICAPMLPAEQERAGLPFAKTQMVVFPSLAEFEKNRDILGGRSGVVHLGPEEVSQWFTTVTAQTTEAKLRFRLKNLHLWDRSHLKAYHDQRLEIEADRLHLRASGVNVEAGLNSAARCPAHRTLATIGPDGLCYPCPTFYYAGQPHGLGALKSLAGDRVFSQDGEHKCRRCLSERCEACLFYESGHVTAGEVSVCELRPGLDKDASWASIVWLKDQSGYLFDNFKSDSFEKLTTEEKDTLWAPKQVDDICVEEFVSALQAINQTTEALIKGTREVADNLISQYGKSVESAPRTPKTLFSYEGLTRTLEDLSTRQGTTAAGGVPAYESVLSQYQHLYQSNQVSRKAFFFETVETILLGLVELSEATKKRQLCWKQMVPIERSTTDAQGEATEDLLLSEEEVTSIRQSYEAFLAWRFLCGSVNEELQSGFEVDKEIVEVIHGEVMGARAEVQRWFHDTGIQHGWGDREGYDITIDFESNLNVSRAYYREQRPNRREAADHNWTAVMKLDGIEKDVIDRLTTIAQTLLAQVKGCLVQRMAGAEVERDLEVAIKMLGHSVLNMSRWYAGMAREYRWPDYQNWRVTSEWVIEGR